MLDLFTSFIHYIVVFYLIIPITNFFIFLYKYYIKWEDIYFDSYYFSERKIYFFLIGLVFIYCFLYLIL